MLWRTAKWGGRRRQRRSQVPRGLLPAARTPTALLFVSGDRNPSRHGRQGMARPGAQTEPVKQPPARQTTCLARRPLATTRTPRVAAAGLSSAARGERGTRPLQKAEPGVPRGRNRGARGVGWWSGVDAAVPLWPVLATWRFRILGVDGGCWGPGGATSAPASRTRLLIKDALNRVGKPAADRRSRPPLQISFLRSLP